MSISSRARRVGQRLPWRSHQRLCQQLVHVRPAEEDRFVHEALREDTAGMKFLQLVEYLRVLGRAREDATDGLPDTIILGRGGNVELDDLLKEDEGDRNVREFLEALNLDTVLRLQTLYYLGRGDDNDPARLFLKVAEGKEHAVEMLHEKLPLDRCLGLGLDRLRELGLEANAAWHVPTAAGAAS